MILQVKNFHIEGIPGDDRNYWKVEKEYNFSNLQVGITIAF